MYTTARRLLRRLTFPKCRVRVATARFRRAEQVASWTAGARAKNAVWWGMAGQVQQPPTDFIVLSKIRFYYLFGSHCRYGEYLRVNSKSLEDLHFVRWVCFKSVCYFAWRLSGSPLDTTHCLCFPGGTTSLFGDSIVKHRGILPCSLWRMISAQPLSGGSRMLFFFRLKPCNDDRTHVKEKSHEDHEAHSKCLGKFDHDLTVLPNPGIMV